MIEIHTVNTRITKNKKTLILKSSYLVFKNLQNTSSKSIKEPPPKSSFCTKNTQKATAQHRHIIPLGFINLDHLIYTQHINIKPNPQNPFV